MKSDHTAAGISIDCPEKSNQTNSTLKSMLHFFNGSLTILMVITNTVLIFPILMVAVVFKFIPIYYSRKIVTSIINAIAELWISINSLTLDLTKKIEWHVTGLDNLQRKKWYLVLSNHQSWSDIIVLQKLLNRRIPILKFFIKQELIWVPLLGVAWWALDFPFMKRFSKQEIAKKPYLAGKDIEATKKACEKFKYTPVSVMNFVEGTRFSEEKKIKRKSEYKNLLNPRAGGAGFVISSMGEYLTDILNVTIKYGENRRNFWDFLSGKVKKITVHIETIPLTDELKGDFHNDTEYREKFIDWLNDLWRKKDNLIERL